MTDDLKPYLCEFPYDGASWCIEVYARDRDDAKRRLERIGTNGLVLGEAGLKIPVYAGGFLVPLIVPIVNWWKRKFA